MTARALPRLGRRVVRLLVLLAVVVASRRLVGVWASSVAMSALFMWCLLRGLRRWDARPAPAQALVPEVIPPPHSRPRSAGPAGRIRRVVVIDLTDDGHNGGWR